ncbi:MAG: Holliday junction resolvase RuvX [Waddliaceae bacterium]|nr:Holliday junction resolvase RuvX [Waddliaceae bacterium]
MQKRQRCLGIDYGQARIGLAISDETKMIARGLDNLIHPKNLEKAANALLDRIHDLEKEELFIDEIVIGLPKHLDGREGTLGPEIEKFVALLKEKQTRPVHFWEERLSSAQAERLMRDSGVKRKKRAENVDRLSAIIILQSYLDQKGMMPNIPPMQS